MACIASTCIRPYLTPLGPTQARWCEIIKFLFLASSQTHTIRVSFRFVGVIMASLFPSCDCSNEHGDDNGHHRTFGCRTSQHLGSASILCCFQWGQYENKEVHPMLSPKCSTMTAALPHMI